jgi:hypothetical protein
LPEKGNAFLRPLKNKDFEKKRVTIMRLDDLGKSTTLESNKSLSRNGVTPGCSLCQYSPKAHSTCSHRPLTTP